MKLNLPVILAITILLAILAGSYKFVFVPSSESRRDKAAQIEQMQKSLADVRIATAGVADLKGKITELQQAIDFFESKLPQEKEMAEVLQEITKRVDKHNLTTKTIKPLKTESQAGYSEMPIEMTIIGNFRSFYAFLLDIEKLDRITRITDMQLVRNPQRDGDMEAKIRMSIFFDRAAGQSQPAQAVAR